MTHEEFVKWIDERIAQHYKDENDLTAGYAKRRLYLELASQLQEVKEKFFTLTPPHTTLS
jgi:hypothetical protein